jgi:ABC-type spermidine/putrescine transport system permease subunit I
MPLFGSSTAFDVSLLESGRDLGGSQVYTFFHVILPLSKVESSPEPSS